MVASGRPLPLSSRPCTYRGARICVRRWRPSHERTRSSSRFWPCVIGHGSTRSSCPGSPTRRSGHGVDRRLHRSRPSLDPASQGAPDAELLRFKGILDRGRRTHLAGVYALGAYPQQFAPSLAISCCATRPADRGGDADLPPISGRPDPRSSRGTLWPGWLAATPGRRSVTTLRVMHATLKDSPPSPCENSYTQRTCHCDLSPHTQGKRVEIRMTQDLLVIGSPGGLWASIRRNWQSGGQIR